MNAETKKIMADMVREFRAKVRSALENPAGEPDVSREVLVEFAVCIVDQELKESSADEDVRAASLIFIKHRLLNHAGDLFSCSNCLGG